MKITSRGHAKSLAVVMLAALLIALGSQERAPLQTVPRVDLDRYAGDWYEVARLPNRFQNRCLGDVRASYARRADGRIDVTNRCRTQDGAIDARGVARIVDEQSFARLKVRFAPAVLSFLPMVWGDYWVIGLADDYSWAVVGSPDRKYLWILSRTPALDAASFDTALGIARDSGFDVGRLIKTDNAKLGKSARRSRPMIV
jgi:apolipoprotein D and lipocalin family protein